MFSYLPVIGFFSAFYSPVGMISYLCVYKIFTVRFGLIDIFFLYFLVGLFFIKLLISDSMLVLLTFRFYFGFFCFYVYFKSGVDFPVRKIFLFLIFLIPLEALLINTIVSPEVLPNFPSVEIVKMTTSDGYQRPYSFAGSPSVSSAILIVMYSALFLSSNFIPLFLASVVMLASGAGTLTLLLYYALSRLKYIAIFSILIFVIFFSLFSEIINLIDSLSYKFSSGYILFLIDFKANQIGAFFQDFGMIDYLIGNLEYLSSDGYGGDFGWLYFVVGYGFLPCLIVILYVLSKATKSTIIPLVLLLLATLHYPAMFYLPGQILLGYLMAQKYVNNVFYK